jgi:zinc/manganese transport system permease protein
VTGGFSPAPFCLMYELLVAPFAEFEFMRRALVGTVAIALGGGPVGVFLMLRRMSLTGDAMAHAILPGAAAAYLVAGLSLPAMTLGGLAAGVVVAILAGVVTRVTALKEDASLAAFYLLSLALGVTLVSLRGSNVDLLHVLFGTVLALDNAALVLLAGIATVTLVTFAVIYRPLVLECVDPVFLRSVSRSGPPTHFVFLGLVVLNLVGGFHALGTLLAVGIMMLPAAAARFWSGDITIMTLGATAIAMLAGLLGLLLSYHSALPAGPAIILTAGIFYLASLALGREGGLLWLASPRPHLEA